MLSCTKLKSIWDQLLLGTHKNSKLAPTRAAFCNMAESHELNEVACQDVIEEALQQFVLVGLVVNDEGT